MTERRTFSLFRMDRWPVIGSWVREDRDKFLQEQARGAQTEAFQPEATSQIEVGKEGDHEEA